MSAWIFAFLLFTLENSVALAKDDPKPSIGEQLDVIIKDVSEYLLWLFGYGYDEVSVEDEIELSEILTEGFLKDVNDMIELMHEEADKHIKHVKDIRITENVKKASEEKINSKEKKPSIEETSEDTSETEEEVKQGSNMTVIPIN